MADGNEFTSTKLNNLPNVLGYTFNYQLIWGKIIFLSFNTPISLG